jgi:hypothetical protein
MTDRRAFLRSIVLAAVASGRSWPAAASENALVAESWREPALGARGVPPGWRAYETPGGRPAYDFTVVIDEGHRALRLKSASEHSTIAKELTIRLAATPVVRWDWKVVTFPAGADLREKSTSDATGHLFVVWPRFPALVRSRLIGYVWDPSLPVGTVIKSRKTGMVTFIVARSGSDRVRQWVTDERPVADDYRRVFGEACPDPEAIALSIDTNDTRSPAEALFGRIAFLAR